MAECFTTLFSSCKRARARVSYRTGGGRQQQLKRNPSLSSTDDDDEVLPESTPECSSCGEDDEGIFTGTTRLVRARSYKGDTRYPARLKL